MCIFYITQSKLVIHKAVVRKALFAGTIAFLLSCGYTIYHGNVDNCYSVAYAAGGKELPTAAPPDCSQCQDSLDHYWHLKGLAEQYEFVPLYLAEEITSAKQDYLNCVAQCKGSEGDSPDCTSLEQEARRLYEEAMKIIRQPDERPGDNPMLVEAELKWSEFRECVINMLNRMI